MHFSPLNNDKTYAFLVDMTSKLFFFETQIASMPYRDLFFLDTGHRDILCHFYNTESYYLFCKAIKLLSSVNLNYRLQCIKWISILQT